VFIFPPVIAICALAPALMADQQPAVSPQATAESKKMPAPARTKPQVIYHLPPSSNYAATLHSQAKSQSNALPIDSTMPTSLQISAPAANADPQPQQEAVTSPSTANESRDSSSQQRAVK